MYVYEFLCANKLSVNVEKSNYITFHPVQKKIDYQVTISLKCQPLKQVLDTSYLGVVIDCHLNWKAHVSMLTKKIKRNVGAISKIRHFVSSDILKNLYYSLVYPFLIYDLVVWGNTYFSSLNTLLLLQKRVVRLMTFSSYYEHTNPLFVKLEILKIHELVFYHNALFTYEFHTGNLPVTFSSFFLPVGCVHNYNTRLASRSSYSLPGIRTNYGKFNIRYSGTKVWNDIDDETKKLKPSHFKKKLKKSTTSKLINECVGLSGMSLNQFMTAPVFFH